MILVIIFVFLYFNRARPPGTMEGLGQYRPVEAKEERSGEEESYFEEASGGVGHFLSGPIAGQNVRQRNVPIVE